MTEYISSDSPLNRNSVMARLDTYGVEYPKELFDDSFTDEQIVSFLAEGLDLDSHGIGLEDLLA